MRQNKKFRILKYFLALVTLTALTACVIMRYYPIRYINIINECAKEYDLKPELIYAVIHAESKFKEEAISSQKASGLMQIMESTAYGIADEIGMKDFDYEQIFYPEINIRFGCYYLYKLEKQYGDMTVALCAYNAGSGNVNKWLNNPEYSNDGRTLKYIPFQETRDYVKRVSDNQKIYTYMLKIYTPLLLF